MSNRSGHSLSRTILLRFNFSLFQPRGGKKISISSLGLILRSSNLLVSLAFILLLLLLHLFLLSGSKMVSFIVPRAFNNFIVFLSPTSYWQTLVISFSQLFDLLDFSSAGAILGDKRSLWNGKSAVRFSQSLQQSGELIMKMLRLPSRCAVCRMVASKHLKRLWLLKLQSLWKILNCRLESLDGSTSDCLPKSWRNLYFHFQGRSKSL